MNNIQDEFQVLKDELKKLNIDVQKNCKSRQRKYGFP